MKARKTKLMALLLTTSVVLAACGDAGTGSGNGNDAASGQTAPAAGDTAGTASGAADLVWWGWTPCSPLNEQYIAKFNETYPDVRITWKQTTQAKPIFLPRKNGVRALSAISYIRKARCIWNS